jgi:hypothetical protein
VTGAIGGGPGLQPGEAEYFRAIEERFCALRGAAMLLSPRDWNLIAGWWEERVPLWLIQEAMEEVFAARRRRGDPPERVNSLAYVRPEIQRRWELHRRMKATRRDEREENERLRAQLRRHLGRAVRSLKEASTSLTDPDLEVLTRTLETAAAELRVLRRESTPEGRDSLGIESILERLDAEILRAAGSVIPEPRRLRIESEAERLLGPHRGAMKPEAFQESLVAVRSRLVRREFGLPRLSLLAED